MKILALILLAFSWVIPILIIIGLGTLCECFAEFMGIDAREDPRSLGERFPSPEVKE